jgi:hypothetical protein
VGAKGAGFTRIVALTDAPAEVTVNVTVSEVANDAGGV